MVAKIGGPERQAPVGVHRSTASRASSPDANVYAMRMAAVFSAATTTLVVRLGLIPRWLAAVGYLTAAHCS